MNTFKRTCIVAVLISVFAQVLWAEDVEDSEDDVEDLGKRPLGCKDVGYRFTLNTLSLLPQVNGDKQSLYFIYNKLKEPVHLYQMRQEESAHSLFLNHTILAEQWGALATSEPELKYICTVENVKSTYGNIVNCNEAVAVCEYARVKFGLNNKGNYWIVNSNTRDATVRDVTRYGIIPR